ncbi:MAG: SusC/RagA family TonB-linked outer membrane protein [Bacteroides sp.]|nr:SusC/RagA family TonB-linked outer membrane protein [Bacteroides sp.]
MKRKLIELIQKNSLKLNKLFLKSGMMALLVMLSASLLLAQESRTVTGTVTDINGEPVPAASVIVQGTTIGVITSEDGSYSIEVPATAENLIFSFVGMTTRTTPIGAQTILDVVIEEDALGLEEVVVVGYGGTKKATLTGAISQIKGDEVMRSKPTSNVANALQGEIPGVVVTRGSSRPGNEDIGIQIRGDISVNNVEPTIIMDGLEISMDQMGALNANDIENISVLKDGSAAIYGTRSAGGVILITTKQGSAGKMRLDYNGAAQMNFANKYPTAGLTEWADLWLLASGNDEIDYVDNDGNPQTAPFSGRFLSKEIFQDISDGTHPLAPAITTIFNTPHRLADNNYEDEIFGTTWSQRHNIALSGGTQQATYRTSVGYANDRSPMQMVYDGAKKVNFRTNIDYKASDLFRLNFGISYDYQLVDEPTQGVGEGLQNPSFIPTYNPAGNFYGLWGNVIPAELVQGGRTQTKRNIARFQSGLTLDLNKYVRGLTFNYLGNLSLTNRGYTMRTNTTELFDWDNNPDRTYPSQAETAVRINNTNFFFQNHVVKGNYDRSLGDHNFGIMFGVTWEETNYDQYLQYRKGMLTDELDDINTGDPASATNGGRNATDWKEDSGSGHGSLVSYLARINYNYREIILVEALGRYDGSSRFHPDYRWDPFFNVSGGVRLSEMDFMKGGFFSNLKPRISYGQTGSVSGIGLYDYIPTVTTGTTYYGGPASVFSTSRISRLTTTERTWERIHNTNFGLDFAILNSRLSGVFEYFIRKNVGMLIPVTYPQVLGIDAPETNSGDFTAKGWEASLNWRDRVGDFRYELGVAMWDSKTEITRMEGFNTIEYGLNSKDDAEFQEGYPVNSLWVFRTDNIMQTEEEIYAYYQKYGFVEGDETNMKGDNELPDYRSANRIVPGCVARVDENGDGVINKDDLYFYGDANAHYSYGINIKLEWKGFDFYAFLQGVGQQYLLREGTLGSPMRNWWMNQNSYWVGNTWTPQNTGSSLPAVFYNGSRKNWNYQRPNDVNVIKASYLRGKVLTLGYTLPRSASKKIGMERLRFSVSGSDLFTFSNVKDGLDPEAGKDQHNGDAYPFSSAVIFGLEVSF